MSDELPADLDVSGYVGPYTFPDLRRRRIAAAVYLAIGGGLVVLWLVAGDGVLVNRGFAGAGAALALAAAYHYVAGWHLAVSDADALVAASRAVGFPIGHAAAQLGWRGLRSRPTWRILLFSADEPPTQRGLVLVDGVDGTVLGHFVEANPEDS